VRAALNRNEKIHVGPRTIVTPSARDLAAENDVLVMSLDGFRRRKA
jgi:ethanolamine utilization cobalamin adenosyltransferase